VTETTPSQAPAEKKGSATRQILGMKGASTTSNIWKIRLQLMKPVTWIPLIWGVLCGAAASGHFQWRPQEVLASLACMLMSGPLLAGYTQTLNDFYDRDIDAINEPYRPIPSGAIPLGQVKLQIIVLLLAGLGLGASSALLLFFWWEVQRPLRQQQQALARVGRDQWPDPQRERGTAVVRQLIGRFNAMVQRLQAGERERAVMLAGIAHDLKSPLTRLRFRLSLAGLPAADLQQAEADITAMERITGQFLQFAGGVDQEAAVAVPLDQLLAEQTAGIAAADLALALEPLERVVRPVALGRAVANLIDNARSYGAPPLLLQLEAAAPEGLGFRIVVWDGGPGIAAERWQQALMPFQRLDAARGGSGHCGLGLAIAARVARGHGGQLERLEGSGSGPQRFGIAIRGRSIAASPAPDCPG